MLWRYPIFVVLTLIVTVFVCYGAYASARLLRSWQPRENLLLLPAENALRGAVTLICVLLGRGSGLSYETLGWQLDNAGGQLFWGGLAGLALALLLAGGGRLLTRYTDARHYRSIVALVLPRNRLEAVLLPFALLLSVLFEEALFRSLLVGGLSPLLPMPWLIVFFGLVFGLLHSPQGAWGVLGAGAAGALFGLLFAWRQSLVAPVVAHFVANGAQIWLADRERRASEQSG